MSLSSRPSTDPVRCCGGRYVFSRENESIGSSRSSRVSIALQPHPHERIATRLLHTRRAARFDGAADVRGRFADGARTMDGDAVFAGQRAVGFEQRLAGLVADHEGVDGPSGQLAQRGQREARQRRGAGDLQAARFGVRVDRHDAERADRILRESARTGADDRRIDFGQIAGAGLRGERADDVVRRDGAHLHELFAEPAGRCASVRAAPPAASRW